MYNSKKWRTGGTAERKREESSNSNEKSMGNRKENMGERVGKKDVVVRYIRLDGDGLRSGNLEVEGKKRNRGSTRRIFEMDNG